MPNWNELLDELQASGSPHDILRRKYLRQLHDLTQRNTIIYYSGWLQKPGFPAIEAGINDSDKVGFITTINGLDRRAGLDLILHTPGGDTAATESLVEYLREVFGANMRAIVPQLAMSAGTMIACACKSIVMGIHSSLGPIDPQYHGLPAHAVLEEFKQAYNDCRADPIRVPLWQPIIAKYSPTLIGECDKAIKWSEEMVTEWLVTGMLRRRKNRQQLAGSIVKELGDHALTKSHNRHLSASKCRQIGLRVETLERDKALQEAVMSVHHACIHTLKATQAYKLTENHAGTAFIQMAATAIMPAP